MHVCIATWLSVKECLKLLIILPTSIIGTPSWYCEQVQDSLALVMVMGKPTYFFTLFATPSGLTSLETSSDRPDNCACVCRAKLLHIKARIKLKDLLGEVVGGIRCKDYDIILMSLSCFVFHLSGIGIWYWYLF